MWRQCFDDTEEFIHFYFEKKYREENALVYRDGQGDAVAALQMPVYPITFAGTVVQSGYISGACTHPLARARGIMTRLLVEAFHVMRGRGIPVSTLIPASDWLYGYYGKMGYAAVFDFLPERYTVLDRPVAGDYRVEAIREEAALGDELYGYFSEMMLQRHGCVQHDREDFNLVVEDLRMSGGALLVAYGGADHIVGMAFAEPRGNHVLVKDWLYVSEEVKMALLSGIMTRLDAAEVLCRSLPTGEGDEHRGMARVLDVERMLRLYAIYHPEQHFVVKVTDEWLPENTGIYRVGTGDCRKEDTGEAMTELSVQELTELLFGYHPERYADVASHFKVSRPFISLMLD